MFRKLLGAVIAIMLFATAAFAVDIDVNASVASSTNATVLTYSCVATNGALLKITVSDATATSQIHYKCNGTASYSDTAITAGNSAVQHLDLSHTLTLVSSTTVNFTIVSIPCTDISVATNTPSTATLVASSVAYFGKVSAGVRFNIITSTATAGAYLRHSSSDFASASTGTIVQSGSNIGVDLASGSWITLYSTTGMGITVYPLVFSHNASQTTSTSVVTGPAANVINFLATDAVALRMVSTTGDVFVAKNASATLTSATKIEAGATYTVNLFTGDYLSFVSRGIGGMSLVGSIADTALELQNRKLTKTFASPGVRTFTFKNKVPRRLFIIPASQTVFIAVNGTASTTSTLKATPTDSLTKRLRADDTISVVATAPISITIRSVPIGR